MGKVVSGIGKGVKKIFKKVAGGIKKVGSKIWGGIKRVGKGIMKAFGKLGPIGMLALSFVIPGIGAALGSMWSSAAGAMAGSSTGWISAIGKGMQFAANAASKVGGLIKSGYNTITSKISDGLKWVGGKIGDGANALFEGAQQAMGVKDPTSLGDMGKWVVDKGRDVLGINAEGANGAMQIPGGELNTQQFMPNSGWSAQTPSVTAPGTVNLSGLEQMPTGSVTGGTTSYATDVAAGIGPAEILEQGGVAQTPQGVPYNPNDQFRYEIPEGTFAGEVPLANNAELTNMAETYGRDKSFTNNLMKAAGSVLQGFAQPQQQAMYVPYMSAGAGDPYASLRGGIGGTGAAGGTFLSQAQLAQQQLLAQQLEQLG